VRSRDISATVYPCPTGQLLEVQPTDGAPVMAFI
jgi:hypothetical protein